LILGRLARRFRAQDAALAVFMLSAAVGLWAAANRSQAWQTFALLTLSVLTYYAVARQPIHRMVTLGWVALAGAVAVAAVFLLTNDWRAHPAEFGWIQAPALLWMQVRPTLTLPAIAPNIAAGLITGLAPLGMLGLSARTGRLLSVRYLIWLAAGLVCAAGLILSSSRGAWMALAAGALVGIGWLTRGAAQARSNGWWQAGLLALVILTCSLWLAAAAIGRVAPAIDSALPGAAAVQSRAILAAQSADLLADFPLTGGGLGAFGALFSRYVMVFPWFYYGYAHNLALDVAISQGLPGLVALVAILSLSVRSALRPATEASVLRRHVQAATLAGLVILVAHGVIDDPFYASPGAVLLFLYPGAARALDAAAGETSGKLGGKARSSTLRIALVGVAAAAAMVIFWSPIRSRGLSNLAAVAMEREAYASGPESVLGLDRRLDADGSIQRSLEDSVRLDPANRTAHQRLGILALSQGDIRRAVDELDAAWSLDAEHRGVRKTLGYALVWSGELEQALPLLQQVPEASTELGFYAWWWRTRGVRALAERSARMARVLMGEGGANSPMTSALSVSLSASTLLRKP